MASSQYTTDRSWGSLPSRIGTVGSVVAHRGSAPIEHADRVKTEHRRPVRVLAVDDDPVILDMVVTYLNVHDIHVIRTSSRRNVVSLLGTGQPSLIMLSLRIGQENGLELLREIRLCSDVPVITTCDGCSEADRVLALESGADDHITKPFGLRELVARIRAILRRRDAHSHAAALREVEQGCIRFGGWELDRRRRRLADPSGTPVALTKGEYTLLTAFLDAPQRSLTREYLLQATRIHEDVCDRSIDAQIFRLRRKLEIDPSLPRVILTERGVGYTFALPVETFQQAHSVMPRLIG